MKNPPWPAMRGYKEIDLELSRTRLLLERLGDPQEALPPVLHVAGTNGKGSVIAFLRAMLEAAGRRVHVYTSPHLVEFNERIVLAGAPITDAYLLEILAECEAQSGDIPLTFFEGTTVAALLAFSRVPADVVLLETGMGGRLDATNVIGQPALTCITPISYDHQAFLGDTLQKIAAEKAGIMKRGVSCVTAPQAPEVMQVLRARAKEIGAKLIEVTAPLSKDTQLGLVGEHQYINAAVAVECMRQLRQFPVTEAQQRAGLKAAHWPARMQRLTHGTLAERLHPSCELWVDGGHNEAAGQVIAGVVQHWRDKPTLCVAGMSADKDAKGFLRNILPLVERAYFTAIPGHDASYRPEELLAAARAACPQTIHTEAVNSSLQTWFENVTPKLRDSRILVCGSLYLAGWLLEQNGGISEQA